MQMADCLKAVRTESAVAAQPPLTLLRAAGFWERMRGLRAWPCLPWHTGLYLAPCKAIHTFGMPYPIDVVFLNAAVEPVRQVSRLAPGRVAVCLEAASVVELPAGYCSANPGYAKAIARCLRPCLRCRRSDS